MADKSKLKPGEFYYLRDSKILDTPFGVANLVQVDENFNVWLATTYSENDNPEISRTTIKFGVLRDEKGNKIPAPENWDDDKPITKF